MWTEASGECEVPRYGFERRQGEIDTSLLLLLGSLRQTFLFRYSSLHIETDKSIDTSSLRRQQKSSGRSRLLLPRLPSVLLQSSGLPSHVPVGLRQFAAPPRKVLHGQRERRTLCLDTLSYSELDQAHLDRQVLESSSADLKEGRKKKRRGTE